MSSLMIGTFQVDVLNAVKQLGENAYGMRIRDQISEEFERDVHMPQIYAALSRLVKLGLLTSDLDEKQSAGQRGRTRRVYKLSADGLQVLSDGVRDSRAASSKELFFNGKQQEAPQA
ncbi:PadR family transcriptional regulator [Ruegeria arenilitoris]|uniref:PadR family transcriptional regulator n=1 Tax=Ruegeria arenilitoris TaxID=1173585 RepID=UPI00147C1871|nr:helix-turn-helix transcriptional regulator [Ruegeria arenilitoris]